jgi:hypothetical protein
MHIVGVLIFMGHVMTDHASGRGAQQAVMAGIVSGNASHHSAFKTTPGVGRDGHCGY